jgi:hypothetical protein
MRRLEKRHSTAMRSTLLLLAVTVSLAFAGSAGAVTPQPDKALKQSAASFMVLLHSGSAKKICAALVPYPQDPDALGTNRPRCLMLMKLLTPQLKTAKLKVVQMTAQPYGNWAVTYHVTYPKALDKSTNWNWLFLGRNGKYHPATTV